MNMASATSPLSLVTLPTPDYLLYPLRYSFQL
jgi:hypothetical protein